MCWGGGWCDGDWEGVMACWGGDGVLRTGRV